MLKKMILGSVLSVAAIAPATAHQSTDSKILLNSLGSGYELHLTQSGEGVCFNDLRNQINERFKSMTSSVCASGAIDTSLTLDGPGGQENPFVYINPDQPCDLGLTMPGVGDFGLSLDGLNSCKVLKAVTGDMVQEINSTTQGSLDEVIGHVTGTIKDQLPNGDTDLDLSDIAIDSINN